MVASSRNSSVPIKSILIATEVHQLYSDESTDLVGGGAVNDRANGYL